MCGNAVVDRRKWYCAWITGKFPSVISGKGHISTPPTTLLSVAFLSINPFVAEPPIPILILKIFDGAGWRMTVKIGIVVYSYLCIVFHDTLLVFEKGL